MREKKRKHKENRARSDGKILKRPDKHSKVDRAGKAHDFLSDAKNVPLAAEHLRAVLRWNPSLRPELRDLLWKVDNGEGAIIEGVPDADLRRALHALFNALNLHRTQRGVYALHSGQDKTLRRIGTVFQEVFPAEGQNELCLPGDALARRPATTAADATGAQRTCTPPIADMSPQSKAESPSPGLDGTRDSPPTARRIMGPTAPAEHVLRAAAAVAEEMTAEGLLEALDAPELAEAFGPPPPHESAGADSTGDGKRGAEVARIDGILARATRGEDPDAFDILQLNPGVSASEAKRAFWRLSLLVHPDKCAAPGAAAAFNAVKQAAHILMDSTARTVLLARRQAKEDARLEAQVAEELDRERRWAVATGEPIPDHIVAAAAASARGPARRDTWMTEVPVAGGSGAPAYMKQKNVTTFGQEGGRAAAVSAPVVELAHNPAALAALPAGVRQLTANAAISTKNAALRSLAESGEQKAMEQEAPQSMLEKHRAKLKEDARQAKKARRAEKVQRQEGKQDWDGKHPWRPFNRETDLDVRGPGMRSGGHGLQEGSSLSSRFRKASGP